MHHLLIRIIAHEHPGFAAVQLMVNFDRENTIITPSSVALYTTSQPH